MKPNGTQEAGQSLILFSLMLVALMGIVALTVDIGMAFRERTNEQMASDAAALAAADVLYAHGSIDQAKAAARSIATTNGYTQGVDGETVTVNIPPNSGPHTGDSAFAEVKITGHTQAQFATVFGFSVFSVDARAVATAHPATSSDLFAVFAGANTCPSGKDIDWTGGNAHVTGRVHTNGAFDMSGSGNTLTGSATDNCTPHDNSNWHPTHSAAVAWPVTYKFLDFAQQTAYTPPVSLNAAITNAQTSIPVKWTGTFPIVNSDLVVIGSEVMLVTNIGSGVSPRNITVTRAFFGTSAATQSANDAVKKATCMFNSPGSGAWNINPPPAADGIYCAKGDLSISSSFNRKLTLVANGKITISAPNFTMTPYYTDPAGNKVLMASFSNNSQAIHISASGSTWSDILYAPNGTVDITGGNNATYSASLIGNKVHISGSNWSLNGVLSDPNAYSGPKVSLVE